MIQEFRTAAAEPHPLRSVHRASEEPVAEPGSRGGDASIVRAIRRQAVLELIARRAAERGFGPAQAAQHLGISVRYLHRLLESSGRTFSEHLIEQRLRCAIAMLRDPEYAHLRIEAVARDAGFSDISHFNRRFRHAFGDTPYGVRVRAARAQRRDGAHSTPRLPAATSPRRPSSAA